MGTTLTGKTIASTYTSLLKISDNGNVGGTIKRISDGAGNDSSVYLSSTQLLFSAGSASVPGLSINGTATTGLYAPSDNEIGITISGTQRGLFTSSGLTVTGYLKVTGAMYDSNDSAGTSNQVLTSTGSATDWKTLSEIAGVDGTGTAKYLSKWSDSDTIANSILYEDSAKIGINNTSPQSVLDLGVTSTNSQVLNIRTNSNSRIGFGVNASYGMRQYGPSDIGATSQLFQWGTIASSDGTTYSDLMNLLTNGNLGLGVTTPSSTIGYAKVLEIKGASSGIAFSTTSYNNFEIGTGSDSKLTISDGGSERMSIASDGTTTFGVAGAVVKVLPSSGQARFLIESPSVNGNNVYLALKSPDTEWRWITNRGDLNSGNQGDLFLREETAGVNVLNFETNNGNATFAGSLKVSTIAQIGSDTDKFLMSDGGLIKYVSGANLLSYIGAAPSSGGAYLPLAGGTMTGHLILNNAVELQSKNAAGTAKTIARITSGDVLQYGWSGSGEVQFMGGGAYTKRMGITTDGQIEITSDDTHTPFIINHAGDITPHAAGRGQLSIIGNSYEGWIALDGTAMYLGNNSSSRNLVLQTNTTDRLTIDGSTGNATFEGNVVSKDTFYLENGSGNRWQMLFDTNAFNLRYYNGSSWSADAFAIDTSNNTTFAGAVTVEGGQLHLGKADTASGHINAKELMTFNIDTDNDDTNRYFGFYTNGEDGSGTELLKILETGAATFAGTVKIKNTSASAYPYLSIEASAKEYHMGVGGASTASGYANNLYIYDNTATAIRLVVDTNGNVGIGTAAPVNNSGWAGLTLSGSTGGQIDFQDDGTTVGSVYNGTWGLAVQAVSGKELRLYGGGSTALTLDSSQNATFAGDISLGDAKKIKLGGAHDFEIYHNNSTNVNHITSLLSRQLKISADTLYITNGDASTTYLSFADGGNATFTGTITAAGGSANNNDDANILTLNASQHARLLVDTSSTSGHRATLVLESNGNELTLGTTGSVSELTSVGALTVTSSATTFTGSVNMSDSISIDYTGSDGAGNDAGIKIENDSSDWGILVEKKSAANFGIRIDSGGANAFQISETVGGSPSFRIGGDGDIEVVKNIVASGTTNAAALTITAGAGKLAFANDAANYYAYQKDASDGIVVSGYYGVSLAHQGNVKLGVGSGGISVTGTQSVSGNATFAGDVSLGATDKGSNTTLSLYTNDGYKTTVKYQETSGYYGFSTEYNGDGNTFAIRRHSNSQTGVAVMTMNRDDANTTFAGTVDAATIGSNTAALRGTSLTIDSRLTLHDGEIDNNSGDLTLDSVGDIILDAGNDTIQLNDSGTKFGELISSSTDFVIKSSVSDKDIIFKGNDGGDAITALTLDMSNGGSAVFRDDVDVGANLNMISASSPTIHVKDTTNNCSLKMYSQDSESIIGTYSAHNLKFFTDSGLTLTLDTSHNATFAGHVATGGEFQLNSGAQIDWANGDARIIEGDTNNFSLSFQTYDGSACSTALRLDGDNTATFGDTGTTTDILRFGPASRWGFSRANSDSRYVSFMRNQNATGTAVWTADGDNGRVGIGTTSPPSVFAVKGSQTYGMARLIPSSANGEVAIGFFADTAGTTTGTSWVAGVGGWGNTNKFVIGYAGTGKSNLTIDTSGHSTFYGNVNADNRLAFKESYFGYSSSYKVVQYGTCGSTSGIALGVDLTGNSSGGFSGNEIVIPNNIRILAPNAANNAYHGVLMFDDDDDLLLGATNYNIDSTYALKLDGSNNNATFAGDVGLKKAGANTLLYLQNTASVTSGNRGDLAFYNSDISTVGLIRAGAVTDNVGTELSFWTRPAGGSLTETFTLESTGSATFAGRVVTGNTTIGNWSNSDRIETSGDELTLGTHSNHDVIINRQASAALTFSSGTATFSGTVGIGHTTPQFGLTLAQGSSDATKIGWEDSSNNKRASILCNSGNDNLEFRTGTSENIGLHITASQTSYFHNSVYLSSSGVGVLSWTSGAGNSVGNAIVMGGESGYGISFRGGASERATMSSTGDWTFAGEVNINSYLKLYTTDDQANRWYLYTHTDDTFRMNYNGSGSDEIILDTSGNITIYGKLVTPAIQPSYNTSYYNVDNTISTYAADNYMYINGTGGVSGLGLRLMSEGAATNQIGLENSNNSIFFNTNSTLTLTLNSDQSATFAGTVGIGTTPASGVALDIREDSTTTAVDVRNANASGYGLYVAGGDTSAQYAFKAADYNNNTLFTVLGDGVSTFNYRVNMSGNLYVTGSVSKGSGSFKIDHPLEDKKDTHHLVHSFIEGPQADLIYRGTVDLVGGTATINIDTEAGMSEGTFVLLNTNTQCFTSNETNWDAVKGKVEGNILTIECQNSSSTATVSWMVVGERQDQHMIDTNWTDENGKVIVEPLKEI